MSRDPKQVVEERDPRFPINHGRSRDHGSRRRRRQRQDKFNEQGGLCWWCREKMSMEPLRITEKGNWKDNSKFASFEHLIPRSMGGVSFFSTNLVLAHAACNNKRHRRKWPHDPIYGEVNDHQASQGEVPKMRPWFHCEAAERDANEPRCVAGEREQDSGSV